MLKNKDLSSDGSKGAMPTKSDYPPIPVLNKMLTKVNTHNIYPIRFSQVPDARATIGHKYKSLHYV